jgi:hypothetical protein
MPEREKDDLDESLGAIHYVDYFGRTLAVVPRMSPRELARALADEQSELEPPNK